MGPNAANVDGAYLIGHIFWQKTLIDSKSDLGLLETRVLEESSVTFDTSIMSWSRNLSSVIFTLDSAFLRKGILFIVYLSRDTLHLKKLKAKKHLMNNSLFLILSQSRSQQEICILQKVYSTINRFKLVNHTNKIFSEI